MSEWQGRGDRQSILSGVEGPCVGRHALLDRL